MKRKTLLYRNKYPQKTWTINLRRISGNPKILEVSNNFEEKLKYSSRIIGDKMIITLKGEPSVGIVRISFYGDTPMFLTGRKWYSRILLYFLRMIGR